MPPRRLRPPARAGAEIILIPKHLRMDWMDVMVLDVDLAGASLKVAGAIGTHFGNKSGMTYISQKKIAKVTGLSEATVKRAITDLEQRGYILIQRREIGERADGRKVYGGKGIANVYLPAVDAMQISATDRGQKLAAKAQKSWDDIQNEATSKQVTNDLLNVPKQVTCDLLNDSQSRSNTSVKQVAHDLPTLSSPSEKNSSRARGPSSTDVLGPSGAALERRIGPDKFKSWFGDVTIAEETEDTLTLKASTQFRASWIRNYYVSDILAAWQVSKPSVVHIRIQHG